jgi:hypothetical protein
VAESHLGIVNIILLGPEHGLSGRPIQHVVADHQTRDEVRGLVGMSVEFGPVGTSAGLDPAKDQQGQKSRRPAKPAVAAKLLAAASKHRAAPVGDRTHDGCSARSRHPKCRPSASRLDNFHLRFRIRPVNPSSGF